MSSRVATSVNLRPTRSPKWPKIAAPIGRAAKPTNCTPNESRMPVNGRLVREEQRREDQRGRGAVEEEVVPLDGGADGAGEDRAPSVALLDARSGLRGLLCSLRPPGGAAGACRARSSVHLPWPISRQTRIFASDFPERNPSRRRPCPGVRLTRSTSRQPTERARPSGWRSRSARQDRLLVARYGSCTALVPWRGDRCDQQRRAVAMADVEPSAARSGRRVLYVVVVAVYAAFVISTMPGVRQHAGYNLLLDGWLNNIAYMLSPILCLRPGSRRARSYRRSWRVLAVGLALYGAGQRLLDDLHPAAGPGAVPVVGRRAVAVVLRLRVRRAAARRPRDRRPTSR